MSEFTLRGNIAGSINLYNEDDVDKARGFGSVYVDKYNPKTGKFDLSDKFSFTGFGRDILNLSESIERFMEDNDGKKPRVIAVVRPGTYEQEGENRDGDVVDKTHIGLTLIEGSLSTKWHLSTAEPDGRAGASAKSGNRRRRKDDDEQAEDQDQGGDQDQDQEEDEPARGARSRSGSGSGSRARSGGSGSRARAGGASRARAGGSRRR
ncbi:MAG: hypothetical protein ACTHV8_04215 [Nesterenkonia sp.]